MAWVRRGFTRYRNSLGQLVRFGLVGGLGVLVNMLVFVIAAKVFPLIWPGAGLPDARGVWWDLPFTKYNVRWIHIMSMVSFFVANLFNFQLNRWWTFKSHRAANWFREYWPFLTVGLIAQGVGMLIMSALVHPNSPIALPTSIFDGSSGLRDRKYWAQLIMIACTVPITFVINKLWTFKAVRTIAETEELEHPEDFVEQGHEA